ncbi:MAG: DUF1214 domain-containing protein, partial [Bacteroidota bacterium]
MKPHILLLILIPLIGFFLGRSSPEKKLDYLSTQLNNPDSRLSKRGVWNGAWKVFVGIGEDSQPAIMRSVIARVGLGANTNEEAIYMSANVDDEGGRLMSNRNYRITVPADMYVQEFWSLTVYGEDHYLIHNEADKYAVSSFHDLQKNEDGTISISLGQKQMGNEANWLPTSIMEEPISITLRCYNPR